jgi:Na+-driven multidrug efflux pump
MNTMTRDDRFLRKKYLAALFPIMFSVMSGTINTLIDSVFVSQKMGNAGLAAVNMCMPVYLIICTYGSLIAGGASIMSARLAGKDEMEKSQKYYHTALTVCLLTGLILSVLGIVFCHEIAGFLAQGGSLTDMVYDYCIVSFIGLIPTAFSYIVLYYLQLEGKNREISVMMTIVVVTDVFLDWLLLYVFNLGMTGAASASAASMLVSSAFGFIQLQRGFSNYRLQIRMLGFEGIKDILRYGSPSAVANFCDTIKLLILNAVILLRGGETAVAVWAVLNSLSEFSLCIVLGVPRAAAPMIGVFGASHENSGIRILINLQLKVGLCMAGAFSLILLVLHGGVELLFALDENLLIPLLCLVFYILPELVNSIFCSYFSASGRIMLSNAMMVLRSFVFPVSAILVITACGGYIWLFLPTCAFLSIIALFVIVRLIAASSKGKEHFLSGILLMDDYLERERKTLDFSIKPTAENNCDASERIKDFCAGNNMNGKQTIQIQLAIEELLDVIMGKLPDVQSVDLRAYALEDSTGIRIRCGGTFFNPFEEAEKQKSDFYMGVEMLKGMSKEVTHSYTLGMNTINIMF